MVEHSHLEMCSLTSLLIRRILPGSLSSAFLSREFAQTLSACNFALQLDLKKWAIEASYFVDSVLELARFEHNWSTADHHTPSMELNRMPAIWQDSINIVNYQ